jgi:hypothetical protein
MRINARLTLIRLTYTSRHVFSSSKMDSRRLVCPTRAAHQSRKTFIRKLTSLLPSMGPLLHSGVLRNRNSRLRALPRQHWQARSGTDHLPKSESQAFLRNNSTRTTNVTVSARLLHMFLNDLRAQGKSR